jgi:hypothetical protein
MTSRWTWRDGHKVLLGLPWLENEHNDIGMHCQILKVKHGIKLLKVPIQNSISIWEECIVVTESKYGNCVLLAPSNSQQTQQLPRLLVMVMNSLEITIFWSLVTSNITSIHK